MIEKMLLFQSDTNYTLKWEDLRLHNNSVCLKKLLAEWGKLLWAAADRICAVQTAAGLACSCGARCFHKGQSSEAPDRYGDVIGSVWHCVSAYNLSASVYTYREIPTCTHT